MSSLISPPREAEPMGSANPVVPAHRPPKRKMRIAGMLVTLAVIAIVGWATFMIYQRSTTIGKVDVPTVRVQRGDVSLTVFAKGEVRGGNSQALTAPMTGAAELHIRSMLPNGAAVKPGDTVVEFDKTDQEFALSEAESDLAEAEQHILQATAQLQADTEETKYELEKAQSDLELAELEARKNPILAAITAKQNDLAVAVAKDKLAQLKQDSANKKETDEAGIKMQMAGQGKAQAKVFTARQNIQSMTLKAERGGYVSIRSNSNVNMIYSGMILPTFQVGDSVRPGMAVAEIPDLTHWEVAANIGELDRGHLSVGDKVNLTVVALPYQKLRGHVTDLGSVSGTPWDRHFECKLALDDAPKELRPGMSAEVEITTETMKNALWLPAQALFESDGKMYVFLRSGKTFARKDVTLVRRNETKVVLNGLQQGQEVALANPTDAMPKKAKQSTGPLEAMPK